MNSPENEQLLGFLLDALDAEEHEQTARQIAADDQLRRRLASLAAVVRPLECDRDHDDYSPPAGLALKTCAWLAAQVGESTAPADRSESADTLVSPLPAALRSSDGSANRTSSVVGMPERREALARRGASAPDLIVAAGIFIAVSFLFFPALANSRYQAHLTACQNNLRQIGMALMNYGELQGTAPVIPLSGNRAIAGIYAPVLYNDGDGWGVEPRSVVCPSSQFGKEPGQLRGIPSLEEIDRAEGPRLAELHRRAGGSYGYNLGYFINGRYSAPRPHRRADFALLADAPSLDPRSPVSDNHGRRGQNVLFSDGRVQYVVDSKCSRCDDDLFRNRLQRVAAGVDENDTVIGRSESSPVERLLARPRD